MRILAADSSEDNLSKIREILTRLFPDAELLCFRNAPLALAAARKGEIDVAFLEAEMPELSGLDLGLYLKELYPLVNLIYMSDSKDYSFEAISLRASGYMLKPVGQDQVALEMSELRHPEEQKKHKRVFAQTFGNFELFVDGKTVQFKYNRTKEIVAILINNRGAQTTNGEIIANLWEDDGDPEKKASYLGSLRQVLQNTLKKLRVNDIIVKQRGSMAIAVDKIECDLFDWLEKKKESKYSYTGDYMNQYSWPEFFHAELDEISYALYDD